MTEDDIDMRQRQIQEWTQEGRRPSFSHWTNRGTFAIEAHNRELSRVTWNGHVLGYDAVFATSAVQNLVEKGSFDRDLQRISGDPTLTAASAGVPPYLRDWNDL